MRAIMLGVASLLLASCLSVDHKQFRSGDGNVFPPSLPHNVCADSSLRERVAARRVEQYEGYDVGIVELDDQGWYWDRGAAQDVLDLMGQAAGRGDVIVVFTHGWQNNADICNDNLVNFRSVLHRLSTELDTPTEDRRVFGLYVAWRGRSMNTALSYALTFWNRKAAAARIARAEGPGLFARIRDVYIHNRTSESRLVVVGHSFGAAITFSAISPFLLGSVYGAATTEDPVGARYVEQPVVGYGDLVVLINPAFEASWYKPFDDISNEAMYFHKSQPTLLLTISSDTDGANKVAFPLGRFFPLLFQKTRSAEQRSAALHSLGKHAPYRTHRLARCVADAGGEPCYGGAQLVPLRPHWTAYRTPFIVASAPDELVHRHGGIFRPAFVKFLVEFVASR